MQNLTKLFEFRVFLILAIITLAVHLLSIFGSFLSLFSDLFLLLFLSYLLAFVLEPIVIYFAKKGLSRIASAAIIYLAIAIITTGFIWVVLPTTISQLTQLTSTIPQVLPENPVVTQRLQELLGTLLNNSTSFATTLASAVTKILLIIILSFYILISRAEISKLIRSLIPDQYEEDYVFIEKVINTTFASFLRIQLLLGLIMGMATMLTLSALKVDYVVSTTLLAGTLATIPIVGTILLFIPVVLATLTISLQKTFLAVAILLLVCQLVYNLLAPKLLGTALKIHPIIVLLSFLIGYKIAGVWGAIFAVPVASSLAIIAKELLKYWQAEADK